MNRVITIIILLLNVTGLFSQQIPDTTYTPPIPYPEYKAGKGPVVFIDEGHFNFHTKDGRYQSFSNLLERDGYVVKSFQGKFESIKLNEGKILVISNALNKQNEQSWYNPVYSAFTEDEILVIHKWVNSGGSLFLIADHMPFGGAAKNLAASFGFEFTNGFAMNTLSTGPDVFSLDEKSLTENSITKGRNDDEKIHMVLSFTGQAFKIPDDAGSLLVFGNKYVNLLPDTAWVFNTETEVYNIEGWSQGAYKKFGKGRVVVFGEAAMFSAQLAGTQQVKTGMNSPNAKENFQLLLNIIHWLDGKLD